MVLLERTRKSASLWVAQVAVLHFLFSRWWLQIHERKQDLRAGTNTNCINELKKKKHFLHVVMYLKVHEPQLDISRLTHHWRSITCSWPLALVQAAWQ